MPLYARDLQPQECQLGAAQKRCKPSPESIAEGSEMPRQGNRDAAGTIAELQVEINKGDVCHQAEVEEG